MIEMTLPTMSCDHCVRTVRRTVEQLDPAARVEVDLAMHRLRIDGSACPPETFSAALTEEGYAPAPTP